MKAISHICLLLSVSVLSVPAAEKEPTSIALLQDQSLTMLEHELLPLAEAMPAEKYEFAPTQGNFQGVRTFSQQVAHIGTVIYEVSASLLGEKSPVDLGTAENGAANLKDKQAVVEYLRAAFAYGHRAMKTVTAKNSMEMIASPFGGKMSRISLAEIPVWHSFDHYGQAVVYARMCGITPPASKPKQD